MKATAIMVEGRLLDRLEQARPHDQSLAAFVRSLLERALHEEELAAAAARYADFSQRSPRHAAG